MRLNHAATRSTAPAGGHLRCAWRQSVDCRNNARRRELLPTSTPCAAGNDRRISSPRHLIHSARLVPYPRRQEFPPAGANDARRAEDDEDNANVGGDGASRRGRSGARWPRRVLPPVQGTIALEGTMTKFYRGINALVVTTRRRRARVPLRQGACRPGAKARVQTRSRGCNRARTSSCITGSPGPRSRSRKSIASRTKA